MTTEILSQGEDIDWSKPQWVINNRLIVFTNGEHNNNTFEGTSLPSDNSYPSGLSSKGWYKSYFKPIPEEGLVIIIKNK